MKTVQRQHINSMSTIFKSDFFLKTHARWLWTTLSYSSFSIVATVFYRVTDLDCKLSAQMHGVAICAVLLHFVCIAAWQCLAEISEASDFNF